MHIGRLLDTKIFNRNIRVVEHCKQVWPFKIVQRAHVDTSR